ncbi:MAG: hypothetical protein COV44_00640 [Deltaproteobacteria bacterium CG11_big_fil_rev_8_21_14_0_20_45_16]|nr:MAG: hypothetical protein COV44_00640 [Deltaproteobacteria bacterium CG11_big_fil_rev_8_21_14_0_20_45_16]
MIKTSLKIALGLMAIGIGSFGIASSWEDALWFALGSMLALANFGLAGLVVRRALGGVRKKFLFLNLLLIKSFVFVSSVVLVLMFVKPSFFPFTLGIGLVIFSLVLWAAWESRGYLKSSPNS